MLGAFIASQIPDGESRNLAHPWTTISPPSPRPLVSLDMDTDTYPQKSQYVSECGFFLPLATETPPPSNILPAITESDATTSPPSIATLFATANFSELEDDDIGIQSFLLEWFVDSFLGLRDLLLLFMTFGKSTALLGFLFLLWILLWYLLWHHHQVVVALGRKNRALQSKIADLQTNPVLFALPPPTSDEDLDEPAKTVLGSTQTETVACSSVSTQTEVAVCSSVGMQTGAVGCSSVGMQTEVATCCSIGMQTEAATYFSVGTQTGVTDSASVWTQTDPVQHQSVGTQTTSNALPEDSDQVAELRATLAKQRKDSDEIIRSLQASVARLGTETGQLRAQLLRTSRSPVTSPSPGGVPTYAGLAYDPHHNPNPEANAQQLAQNRALQQQRMFQQSPHWQASPGWQGRGQ